MSSTEQSRREVLELLKAVVGEKYRHITGEEREKISAVMQHITDLKPGDKVRSPEKFNIHTIPGNGEIVEVFNVFPIRLNTSTGKSAYQSVEYDFSILVEDLEGDYIEYLMDSRRFERVPD